MVIVMVIVIVELCRNDIFFGIFKFLVDLCLLLVNLVINLVNV